MKIFVMNGPNLNMLGKREVSLYGKLTLNDIIKHTEKKVTELSSQISLEWYQSNHEGFLIDKIHEIAASHYQALVINPGALSHTSMALYDALQILSIPIAEVHLTNLWKRETDRHTLLTARSAEIIMAGLGADSYYQAIYYLFQKKADPHVSNN